MLKFKSASYSWSGDMQRNQMKIQVQDGKQVREVIITRRDASDIFKTLLWAFGLQLGNGKR